METADAIEKMIETTGTSKYALSKRLDRAKNYIQNTLTRRTDVSAGNLARIAAAMGYRLVLMGPGELIEVTPASDNIVSTEQN